MKQTAPTSWNSAPSNPRTRPRSCGAAAMGREKIGLLARLREPAPSAEYAMTVTDRIEMDPKVMLGKPVIRGTRIPVELLLRKLGEGATEEDLLDAYPRLKREDIRAALLANRAERFLSASLPVQGRPLLL